MRTILTPVWLVFVMAVMACGGEAVQPTTMEDRVASLEAMCDVIIDKHNAMVAAIKEQDGIIADLEKANAKTGTAAGGEQAQAQALEARMAALENRVNGLKEQNGLLRDAMNRYILDRPTNTVVVTDSGISITNMEGRLEKLEEYVGLAGYGVGFGMLTTSINARLSDVESKLSRAGMTTFFEKWCDCSSVYRCHCY